MGFRFALASDIRIITPDARFCAAYINIGLGGADMCSTYLLPRIIGAGRAYEIMYLGKYISAGEAINMNLDAGGMEQALNIEDRNQAIITMASGVR